MEQQEGGEGGGAGEGGGEGGGREQQGGGQGGWGGADVVCGRDWRERAGQETRKLVVGGIGLGDNERQHVGRGMRRGETAVFSMKG